MGAELDRGRLEAPAAAFLLHLLESPGRVKIRAEDAAPTAVIKIFKGSCAHWNHQKIGRLGVGPLTEDE